MMQTYLPRRVLTLAALLGCLVPASVGAFTITTNGPNAYCLAPLTPMTGSQTTILTGVNNMQATGDTFIDLGLAWGWRMLSPRWQGQWGGEMGANNLPLNYGTPRMNKAIILLTDGYNNITPGYYGAYGKLSDGRLGTTNQTQAIATLNTRTVQVCNSLKSNGIYVYTVALDTVSDPIDANTLQMLQNCATSPNYFFHSPSASQLQGIFSSISDSLANLRVSK